MRDVNWWLAVLSFLLGLLLTLAMMIRKVTREVPVSHPASAAVTGAAATLHAAAAEVDRKVERVEQKVDRKVERVEQKFTGHAETIEQILEEEPYGTGSIRVARRSTAPAGYTVKGDKDTGRFFTTDSPEYAAIEAEVWFSDEASAAKAGFLRWDARGAAAGTGAVAGAAAVVTEDHSHSDTTMVIRGGDTLPPEAAITILSQDRD